MRTEPIAGWRESEKVAASWMVAMGYDSAKVSPDGPDAGVDVRAPRKAIAQVKFRQLPIGRAEIQLLVGSRHPQLQEKMLFFSSSGYLPSAVQWADLWNVALFRFDDEGNPYPENDPARDLSLASGYGSWSTVTPPADKWVSRDSACLRREPILSSTGKPVRDSRSATIAIRQWASRCGYTDACRPVDQPELVTAKGLAILARFRGEPINAVDISAVAKIPGERTRVAVSWIGFSKRARQMARERSIAILDCSANGILTEVKGSVVQLFSA